MNKGALFYLKHMIEAVQEAMEYAKDGLADKKSFRSVERCLEIMGEAANQMPVEFHRKYPEIPWKNIIGTRHKLIHDYFGVDMEIIEDIMDTDLPHLKAGLLAILEKEGD